MIVIFLPFAPSAPPCAPPPPSTFSTSSSGLVPGVPPPRALRPLATGCLHGNSGYGARCSTTNTYVRRPLPSFQVETERHRGTDARRQREDTLVEFLLVSFTLFFLSACLLFSLVHLRAPPPLPSLPPLFSPVAVTPTSPSPSWPTLSRFSRRCDPMPTDPCLCLRLACPPSASCPLSTGHRRRSTPSYVYAYQKR